MAVIPPVLDTYMHGLKTHDVAAIAGTLADHLVVVLPDRMLRKDQFLTMLHTLYAGFPDWLYEHDAAENLGEVYAVRWRQSGTHTGVFALPGMEPIAPTGLFVKIPEHHFYYKIQGKRIIEIRPEPIPGGAPLGILEQIGARLPPL